MNLPLPSGSSPAENPPGIMRIWARRMAWAMASRDSSTARASRLRNTTVSVTAPARSNTWAVSYSQLVPGNTVRTTRGRAMPRAGACGAWSTRGWKGGSAGTAPSWRVGKMGSSGASQTARARSSARESPFVRITGSAWVVPRRVQARPSRSSSRSPSSSSTRAPGRGANQWEGSLGSSSRPTPLPKAMIERAGARPSMPTARAASTLPSRTRRATWA